MESVAAVLRAFGKPQALERVEVRDPGPGEVRVRMLAAGVCHSDVGQADGEWSFPLPAVLGHEGVGRVESLGPGVEGLAAGERVVLSLAPGCAACEHCVAGRPIRCQAAFAAMADGVLTTGPSPFREGDEPIAAYSLLACFAGRTVVSAASAIPIPDDVPSEVAALVGCAVITGFGAATETAAVTAGSRGAVIGIGGVGASALQAALLRGAAEVTAIDPARDRRARASRLGATTTVDAGDEKALAALRRAAPRDGFDWAIVTVGVEEAIRLAVDVTKPGGTTVVVGLMPEGRPVAVDMLDVVNYEKTIRGSAYGSISPRLLVPQILGLYREGRLRIDQLVSDRMRLDDINEAFARSRRAEGMRVVLTISDEGS